MCASSECPDDKVAFAQALLSCRCSHINRQVCLISWHVFQSFLRLLARRKSDFVPEELDVKVNFTLIKVQNY